MRGGGRKSEGFIFRLKVERREKLKTDSSPVERLFKMGQTRVTPSAFPYLNDHEPHNAST
jgi:hypothetical protein